MKPLMNWMHPWWRRDAVKALSSFGKQRSSDLSGSDQATKTKSVRFWESTLSRYALKLSRSLKSLTRNFVGRSVRSKWNMPL